MLPGRAIPGVILDISSRQVTVLSSARTGVYDSEVVAVVASASGDARALACSIIGRSTLHAEATLLELRFDFAGREEEAFVWTLVTEFQRAGRIPERARRRAA